MMVTFCGIFLILPLTVDARVSARFSEGLLQRIKTMLQ